MALIRREGAVPVHHRDRERSTEWEPYRALREMMSFEPFRDLWRPWERMAQQVGTEGMTLAPAFDVKDSKDQYVIHADVPGLAEGDIDVDISGNRLTVSGKREVERADENDTYYVSERSFGSFTRSFTLPDDANADGIKAELKNGMLSLTIPKTGENKHKKIPLRSS